MNFDPKGTTPGLNPGVKPEPKIQHLKCRENSCDSVQAIEITALAGGVQSDGGGANHTRLYQCIKCKHTWVIGVGGNINI